MPRRSSSGGSRRAPRSPGSRSRPADRARLDEPSATRRLGERQDDAYARAPWNGPLHRHRAAVPLDDLAHERQPEAAPAAGAVAEALEEVRSYDRIDAGTFVVHLQHRLYAV